MLFVAANDLLVMFVALEVFSLPLYLLCALARRRRLLSQEAAVKYFLLGAFASAFFLFGAGAGLRLRRQRAALRRSARPPAPTAATSCSSSAWRCSSIGLLFKASAAPFHVWTPDVYQGAPTPVTALHGRLHEGRRVRRRSCGCSTWPSARSEWTWRPLMLGVAIVTMLVGAVLGRHPDRPQAACSPTRRSPTPATCSSASSGWAPAARAPACPPRCSTWSPTASRRSPRSPSSRWCATATARPRTCRGGPGSARRSPLTAAVFTLPPARPSRASR